MEITYEDREKIWNLEGKTLTLIELDNILNSIGFGLVLDYFRKDWETRYKSGELLYTVPDSENCGELLLVYFRGVEFNSNEPEKSKIKIEETM